MHGRGKKTIVYQEERKTRKVKGKTDASRVLPMAVTWELCEGKVGGWHSATHPTQRGLCCHVFQTSN